MKINERNHKLNVKNWDCGMRICKGNAIPNHLSDITESEFLFTDCHLLQLYANSPIY